MVILYLNGKKCEKKAALWFKKLGGTKIVLKVVEIGAKDKILKVQEK